MKKYLVLTGLVLLALGERLWFDLGPNVELVMLSSVIASIYLGRRWAVAVAVISLALSDLVLGNTMIMVFTWSALALIAWGGGGLKRWSGLKRVIIGGSYGLLGALFFYLYTNFGVWLIGGLYPLTLQGLVKSYVMGLPFLRIHAVSSGFLLMGGLTFLELAELTIKELNGWGIRLKSGAVPQL